MAKRVPLYWYEQIRALERLFYDERDRRIAEVAAANDRRMAEVADERAKALQIKQAGDDKALVLAREIQSYRDERDNRLREQIESERVEFITRTEFKPVADFVTAQQGGGKVWAWVAGAAFAGATLALSAAAIFT